MATLLSRKRMRFGTTAVAVAAAMLCLSAFGASASAQTGRVRGKVVDANNKPVDGAAVTIVMTGEMNRKFATKSDRRGEFTQFVPPGVYMITATKDNMTEAFEVKVGLDEKEVNFSLKPAAAGAGPGADATREVIQKMFSEAVALSNEGKNAEAVAKFNDVIAKFPKCTECYTNIGATYNKTKEYDKAEAAFKKAIEVDPNSADAYSGLANVYNGQRKFDEASVAAAQAQKLMSAAGATAAGAGPGGAAPAGGVNANSIFSQGVIAWNAGKIPEAEKLFAEAVKTDPKLADAHYWLGMAAVNQGKTPEAIKSFDDYLKLAPTGQYAEQAKGMLSAIKK